MIVNKKKQWAAIAGMAFFSALANAGTAVIVHPETSTLKKQDVNRAFLGFAKRFPSGQSMQLIDQPEGSASREAFYRDIVRKTPEQMKKHWARLVFTGKGRPPSVLEDEIAIRIQVANTPGAIGYIDEAVVDSSVKVVFILP